MGKIFAERCYALLRKVPEGRVTTYQELAHALGTRAYRAVGQAMNKNPYAPQVPCHRVICADGTIGGFAGGVQKKRKMLSDEGIEFEKGKIRDLDTVMYRFQR